MVSSINTQQDLITSAHAAMESYLVVCGMSHAEAVRPRDEIMLSHGGYAGCARSVGACSCESPPDEEVGP